MDKNIYFPWKTLYEDIYGKEGERLTRSKQKPNDLDISC